MSSGSGFPFSFGSTRVICFSGALKNGFDKGLDWAGCICIRPASASSCMVLHFARVSLKFTASWPRVGHGKDPAALGMSHALLCGNVA